MSDEIMNTGDMQGVDEFDEPRSDLTATTAPTGKGIEFNVSMRDHTMQDMEGLIVEAAAFLIVGRYGDKELARAIEARVMKQVTEKADATLHAVTNDMLDRPLTPTFGDKKPVTMREFIGLTGREYLSQRVNNDGSLNEGSGWGSSSSKSRIEWLVWKYMDTKFKNEIEKATNATIAEVRNAIAAQHASFLAAEKQRFREALDKTVAK